MKKLIHTVLIISASDSSGGAGMQADVRTISSCGLWPLSVVTAVTAQNSSGIRSIYPIPPQIVEEQFMAAIEEAKPYAVKIGAVGNSENLIKISEILSKYCPNIPIVLDPVISASSGGKLSTDEDKELMGLYEKILFPLSTIITPNIPEVINFLKSYSDETDIEEKPIKKLAERFLRFSSAKAVVLKGGHTRMNTIMDILAVRTENETSFCTYRNKRIPDVSFHGTGCVYSSLLASALATGTDIRSAFMFASAEIHQLILDNSNRLFPNDSYPPLLMERSVKIEGNPHRYN